MSQQQELSKEELKEIEDNRKKAAEARKQIVARVDGVDINMFDLLGMMNRVANAFYKDVKEPDEAITREIKQRALDRLIFEELAVKEAVKQGITSKPEKTQESIDGLKESYETPEGFQNYLADLALTEEQLKARIERSQLLEGITGREVYQKQGKDPEAVERLYKEYKEAGKLRKGEAYFVKEIFVMAGQDKAATKATAEKLLAQFNQNNHDFAKLLLDGTFIVRKIRVDKNKYPDIFDKMLGMQIGQFSDVVEDGGSFHIFEVLQKDPSRDLTEEEARTMLEDRLAPYFQEMRRKEWVDVLRKDAKIEILLEELKQAPPAPEIKGVEAK
ncbi:MAG: peptidyl-prolyl cis-trans isomerase [Deltaproteobacteria bacterium]|nr:peptidyl-prolyl cis-trans isomerase [Deltaproteobacteria bacterium]